jgi:hypothetical protein
VPVRQLAREPHPRAGAAPGQQRWRPRSLLQVLRERHGSKISSRFLRGAACRCVFTRGERAYAYLTGQGSTRPGFSGTFRVRLVSPEFDKIDVLPLFLGLRARRGVVDPFLTARRSRSPRARASRSRGHCSRPACTRGRAPREGSNPKPGTTVRGGRREPDQWL